MNNTSIKAYNTFGFDVKARYFVEIRSVEELKTALHDPQYKSLQRLFLGGGSNVLFLDDFDGVIFKIAIKGITLLQETDEWVIVQAGAGEIWHKFVLECINRNLCGIENLSLIPGTVGAAPMQNIGAYGVEIKDTFYQLQALNLETLEIETFNNDQCKFGYRESYFKHEGKNRYVILYVSFKLKKTAVVNVSYGTIAHILAEMGVSNPTIQEVSNAVIKIRQSKLPDPAKIGNAGSFFKNPIITEEEFLALRENYPDLPGYPADGHKIKVAAGWLIEQTGWKGKKVGHVGVHDRQALVLVHYGNGKGSEIVNLAESIQKSVFDKFKITIIPEVNYII